MKHKTVKQINEGLLPHSGEQYLTKTEIAEAADRVTTDILEHHDPLLALMHIKQMGEVIKAVETGIRSHVLDSASRYLTGERGTFELHGVKITVKASPAEYEYPEAIQRDEQAIKDAQEILKAKKELARKDGSAVLVSQPQDSVAIQFAK